MADKARPICGSRSAPSHPVRASGISVDPRADRLDHQDIREPGQDGLAARALAARLGRDQTEGAVDPVRRERLGCGDDDRSRHRRDQIVRCRVAQPNGGADHRCGRAAAAEPQDLIAVGDSLEREVEDRRGVAPRSAPDSVAFAMGNERNIARAQRHLVGAVRGKPGAPVGDHVEPHVALHRREGEPPWRGQFRVAVEGTRSCAAHGAHVRSGSVGGRGFPASFRPW